MTRKNISDRNWAIMPLYSFNLACSIYGFMNLTPYYPLPLALSSQNRGSSLHATYFQTSTHLSLYSLAQARRAARWRTLRNVTLIGRQMPKPIRWRQRCTVNLLTVRLAPAFTGGKLFGFAGYIQYAWAVSQHAFSRLIVLCSLLDRKVFSIILVLLVYSWTCRPWKS